jgi:hypothetical protein
VDRLRFVVAPEQRQVVAEPEAARKEGTLVGGVAVA